MNLKKRNNLLIGLKLLVTSRHFLKGLKNQRKKVIFIDEFPWVDSHKSGFLAAFENFWNDYCTTRSDLVVVVCESAASYMVKKIISNSKGLSKRISQLGLTLSICMKLELSLSIRESQWKSMKY